MVGRQTSRTWVISGCGSQRTDGWDVSQHFLHRLKDRRLGLEPNSFSVGRQTDIWDSSRMGLEPNSFSVGRLTEVWDLFRLGLKSIVSALVDGQTSVTRVNSFGHILCKEVPCLTVFGTRKLTMKATFLWTTFWTKHRNLRTHRQFFYKYVFNSPFFHFFHLGGG